MAVLLIILSDAFLIVIFDLGEGIHLEVGETPLVDSHFHIWTRNQPLSDSAWHAPPTNAPLEDCLKVLDDNGVVFGVIAAASIHGDYNDYVRAALKAHKRFRATAVLKPTTSIYQMEQMKEEGFVGVRLMWSLSDEVPNLNSGEYRTFLRRIADLGWHVHLIDQPDRVANSIAVIEDSGAKLVIDHMGHLQTPEGAKHAGFQAVLASIERGNTWVKISCRFRFDPNDSADQYAKELLRVGANDRVLWGSDWPFAAYEGVVTYDDVLADYEYLVPDPAMRRKIDETALRFYFT